MDKGGPNNHSRSSGIMGLGFVGNTSTEDSRCSCGRFLEMVEVQVSPTTGGQFNLRVAASDSVEYLRKLVSKRLRVPKERICLLYRDRHLRLGTLEENSIGDGARITLLPSVETGLLAQRPEQSVMQALESLNDGQVNDFLTGKAPLNLTMRLGDHMMLIQLQLSTVSPSRKNSSRVTAGEHHHHHHHHHHHYHSHSVSCGGLPSPSSSGASTSSSSSSSSAYGSPHHHHHSISPSPSSSSSSSSPPVSPSSSIHQLMTSPPPQQSSSSSFYTPHHHVHHHHHHHPSSPSSPSSSISSSPSSSPSSCLSLDPDAPIRGCPHQMACTDPKASLDTKALAEASRNLTQTLKQLSSEVLTTKPEKEASRPDPQPERRRTPECSTPSTSNSSKASSSKRQGAIIESMRHHGKGVYSGTFSGKIRGTLNPALQDRQGRPKRDISTIIHILNDLLCATPQYRRHSGSVSAAASAASNKDEKSQLSAKSPPSPTVRSTQDIAAIANRLSPSETDKADSAMEIDDVQVTRTKLEHLRMIMEQRRARRKARREARSSPYGGSSPSSTTSSTSTSSWSSEATTTTVLSTKEDKEAPTDPASLRELNSGTVVA